VQFSLLHSKYHLCSIATRALLLSTYIKFVNLFPEIKANVQEVLVADSNIRNPDAELQQRAVEYLTLSRVAGADVLATVLEEMPPYAEKESSLLTKLKSKKPQGAGGEEGGVAGRERKHHPSAVVKESAVRAPVDSALVQAHSPSFGRRRWTSAVAAASTCSVWAVRPGLPRHRPARHWTSSPPTASRRRPTAS